MGKIVIVNTLVNTLFTHKFLCLPTPPKEFFKEYKEAVLKFIWNDKPSKIKYFRLVNDYAQLGLKLVDLEIKELALKAAWPTRWAERKQEKLQWAYYLLPIKDNRIWEANLSPEDVNVWRQKYKHCFSVIPSILYAWTTATFTPNITDPYEMLNQNLWANSLIRWRNMPMYDECLVNSNIDKILDIYDVQNYTFVSYNTLVEQFGPVLDPLYYASICVAIPKL